ncbi:MAG: sulfotransferase [Pseudomonadota bacterium]
MEFLIEGSHASSDAAPGPPATARQWFDRGKERQQAGDLAGALDAYRNSLSINPRAAAAWIGLAEVLDANQQPLDALECLKRGAAAEPYSVIAATRLARSFQGLGKVDDARRAYDRALAIDGESPGALLGLGELCEDLGDPEGAAAAYRKVLRAEPERADALANVLGLGRAIDISPEIETAERLMESANNRDKALIGFGLGKALDRLKRYDDAFDVLASANSARREDAGAFDRDQFDARIQRLENLFTADFYQQRAQWGNSSALPVFIVGLPRSGTTLTEQIIGSHPLCHGAGELGVLADLATGTPDRLGRADPPWPQCAVELSKSQANSVGDDYVAQVQKIAPTDAVRVVDKQPLNFWHLGLVALALPNAKIIHCTRDIRDNGLSIFSQNFNPGQRWSTDLADIGYYWQGYQRLMAHWRKTTALEFIDVSYEDTVIDTEGQARRLLRFLGLEWDEGVLSFHKNDRAVQTPSRWQVRQPIYSASKARWRRYERYLEALINAAGDAS